MNIYEKLLAITTEIKTVNKNLEVGVGKSKYKAVGEADVLYAVKELESKYKIYSYPFKREIVQSDFLETEKEYDGKITRGNQIFLRIETIYRFVNIENPEEYIDVITYGDGIDTQDKAVGKAMTYADKYALMKAYKIITGDDPDVEHSPDNVTYKKQAYNYEFSCDECGKQITEAEMNYSIKNFGRKLCRNCQSEAKKQNNIDKINQYIDE